MVIKSVGILSVGKLLGCLYAILGLLAGGFMSLVSLIGVMSAANQGQGMFAAIFGVGAIILLPIIYGLMGFIGGIICAALYNVVASFVGGIEIQTA